MKLRALGAGVVVGLCDGVVVLVGSLEELRGRFPVGLELRFGGDCVDLTVEIVDAGLQLIFCDVDVPLTVHEVAHVVFEIFLKLGGKRVEVLSIIDVFKTIGKGERSVFSKAGLLIRHTSYLAR